MMKHRVANSVHHWLAMVEVIVFHVTAAAFSVSKVRPLVTRGGFIPEPVVSHRGIQGTRKRMTLYRPGDL